MYNFYFYKQYHTIDKDRTTTVELVTRVAPAPASSTRQRFWLVQWRHFRW